MAGNATPLYLRRHLDVLMVGNHPGLLEKAQLLIDGNRDEEPLGKMAAYTDGAVQRLERWTDVNSVFRRMPSSSSPNPTPSTGSAGSRRAGRMLPTRTA
jgi:hypothetical protein